ncbi:MAG: DUF1127 domain-containing protein [Pseudomonadota bacterium]
MAYANTHTSSRFDLVARVRAVAADAAEAWARYRTYRETLDQLQELTDRELDDLGLSRWSLKDVARQSAYDA